MNLPNDLCWLLTPTDPCRHLHVVHNSSLNIHFIAHCCTSLGIRCWYWIRFTLAGLTRIKWCRWMQTIGSQRVFWISSFWSKRSDSPASDCDMDKCLMCHTHYYTEHQSSMRTIIWWNIYSGSPTDVRTKYWI